MVFSVLLPVTANDPTSVPGAAGMTLSVSRGAVHVRQTRSALSQICLSHGSAGGSGTRVCVTRDCQASAARGTRTGTARPAMIATATKADTRHNRTITAHHFHPELPALCYAPIWQWHH